MSSTAQELTAARTSAGLTQAALAARAGTSQPAVNRYERGRVEPSPDTLRRLLAACTPRNRRPSELLIEHRDEVLAFAHRHGASTVLVFGSVARGDDDEDSDVDLLMDLPSTYSLFDMAGLQAELSDIVGTDVDLGAPDELRARVRERVLAEARPL